MTVLIKRQTRTSQPRFKTGATGGAIPRPDFLLNPAAGHFDSISGNVFSVVSGSNVFTHHPMGNAIKSHRSRCKIPEKPSVAIDALFAIFKYNSAVDGVVVCGSGGIYGPQIRIVSGVLQYRPPATGTANVSSSVALTVGETYVVFGYSWGTSSTEREIWVNGANASDTKTNTGITTSINNIYIGENPSAGSVTPDVDIVCAALWKGFRFNEVLAKELTQNPWQIFAPRERKLNYFGLGVVTSDLQLDWHNRENIGSLFDLNWNVLENVQQDSQLDWHVRENIQQDSQLDWQVFGRVTSEYEIGYDITGYAISDLQLDWHNRHNVQQDSQLDWNILSSVQVDSQLDWAVLGNVNSDLDIVYDITGSTLYAENDLSLAYNVVNYVQQDSQLDWAVTTSVQQDSNLDWAVFGRVVNDYEIDWDVDGGLGTVTNDLSILFNVISNVSQTSQFVWNIRNSVQQDSNLDWAIAAAVQNDLSFFWNFEGFVISDLRTRWNMLNSVEQISQVVYNILNLAQNDLQLDWQVVSVTRNSFVLRWNVEGEAIPTGIDVNTVTFEITGDTITIA